MSEPSSESPASVGGANTPDPRRWKAPALLCTAYFMIIVDSRIAILPLPYTQSDFGFTTSGAQWAMGAYLIGLGGLLLLGGHRMFMIGTALLIASVIGGLADGSHWISLFPDGFGFGYGIGTTVVVALCATVTVAFIAIALKPADRAEGHPGGLGTGSRRDRLITDTAGGSEIRTPPEVGVPLAGHGSATGVVPALPFVIRQRVQPPVPPNGGRATISPMLHSI